MLGTDLYVRITRNTIRVKNLKSGEEASVIAEVPFSTTRLLVGHFESAEKTLKAALAKAGGGSFVLRPRMLVHAMELVEGGLSQIEERVLHEMGIGAGAKKVVVYAGPALADADVSAKLRG
jgi:hypothetical protein